MEVETRLMMELGGEGAESYGTDPRQHMNSGSSSSVSREAANEEPALRQHMASS